MQRNEPVGARVMEKVGETRLNKHACVRVRSLHNMEASITCFANPNKRSDEIVNTSSSTARRGGQLSANCHQDDTFKYYSLHEHVGGCGIHSTVEVELMFDCLEVEGVV